MRAIRYEGIGTVSHAEVPDPVPAPGHAIVRVRAAGVCQTDVHFRANPELAVEPGRVLGHEISGTIEQLDGDGGSFSVGDPVIVYTVWSCGNCRECVAGRQNACLNTAGRLSSPPAPGVAVDGGLAEFVSVPITSLVPADGLDPVFAATLTDAGLVPYHCIRGVRDLLRPGSSALVIGLGGLGQFAVAILRAMTPASIIAIDTKQAALDAVRDRVDHAFLSTDSDIADQILAAAGGHGPDVVIDFVGATPTLALAGSVVAPYGAIRVPGQSNGVLQFETDRATTVLPRGATIDRPYSGTRQDLLDLVSLARTGKLETRITRYSFDDALQAFDDLSAGAITGRAVVVMD